MAILESNILLIKFLSIHGSLTLASTGIVKSKDKNHVTILEIESNYFYEY